jgi:hypothetical protein
MTKGEGMAEVSCLYCGEIVQDVEVTDETRVLAVAHTACHAQAQEPRTCPGCNALLIRPAFTKLGIEGYVCDGCRTYYNDDLEPLAYLL